MSSSDVPDINEAFVLDVHDPSVNYESFLRSALSLTMLAKSPQAFGDLVDALKKVEHSPGQTLQVELPYHVGSIPMSISSELVALETLTYFNICSKSSISRDEWVYTLTDSVGKNFALCLSATLADIGRGHGGPTALRQEALRRGSDPTQYVHHLLRSKILEYSPPDEMDLRRDVQHVSGDLHEVIDIVRAELAFYLIDDNNAETNPESWN